MTCCLWVTSLIWYFPCFCASFCYLHPLKLRLLQTVWRWGYQLFVDHSIQRQFALQPFQNRPALPFRTVSQSDVDSQNITWLVVNGMQMESMALVYLHAKLRHFIGKYRSIYHTLGNERYEWYESTLEFCQVQVSGIWSSLVASCGQFDMWLIPLWKLFGLMVRFSYGKLTTISLVQLPIPQPPKQVHKLERAHRSGFQLGFEIRGVF